MLRFLISYLLLGSVFWPFWNSFITGLFGFSLGSKHVHKFTLFCITFALISAWFTFFMVILFKFEFTINMFYFFIPSTSIVNFFNIFQFGVSVSSLKFSFLFDYLTVIMLIVVCTISWLVHLYAMSYLNTDPHQARFFSYLSLFTGFMLFLVTSANLFMFFIGWEGVGICSYLLISFWYTRVQAVKSALQAVMVNKVGDVALFIAMCLLMTQYNILDFKSLTPLMAEFAAHCPDIRQCVIFFDVYSIDLMNLVSILFFIAAVAKSAQLGLHTWLLSAMEGPTPVSALLHAATMVTAGIFLILRCEFILPLNGVVFPLMVIWGSSTAFFAALCGLVQHDIKKVIAFSTCSQLGYMFYACGLSEFNACLYHLTNHAFFKALLFMCAGAIIHVLNGEQDLRRMGGLVRVMPMTYISMLIASLALIGFPFLSGFYSKDILIELAFGTYQSFNLYAYWLATLSAFITAFYSTRLLFWVFLANPQFYKNKFLHLMETDTIMLFTFRVLMLGSLFSGYFLKDLFMGMGNNSFGNGSYAYNHLLYTYVQTDFLSDIPLNYIETEFLPTYIKLIPVIGSLFGVFLAMYIYSVNVNLIKLIKNQLFKGLFQNIYVFFVKKGYFDMLYNNFIAKKVYVFAWYLFKYGDQGIFEWMGPQGISYYLLNNIRNTYQLFSLQSVTLHSTVVIFTRLVMLSLVTFVLVIIIL